MKIQGINQLTDLSDIELFVALCDATDDAAIYTEFVNRFLPDLMEECKNYCKNRQLDTHVGIQIVHETFEKARKYKSFKTDEIKARNERKAVLVYLYRIAFNLFRDYLRKTKKNADQSTNHKSYFDDLFETTKSDQEPASLLRIKDAAVGIIKKLTPKEQKVFLTDLEYKRNQKYNYLPDHVNEELAAELGIKGASVRKIRERAITKIKKAIDEINQKTG